MFLIADSDLQEKSLQRNFVLMLECTNTIIFMVTLKMLQQPLMIPTLTLRLTIDPQL